MPQKIYINGRFLTQPITGVQRYGHEIVSAFDRLLCDRKIDPDKYLFILLIPSKKILFNPGYQKIQKKAIGKFSGHLWEQLELPKHSSDGLLFCPGNNAPISSLNGDQKVVVTVHDLSYQYFPEAYSLPFKMWYHFLIPKIFAQANVVITVSNSEKTSLIKYFPEAESKIYVVQNGGLSEDILKRISNNKNQNQKNSILYVGALNRRKNIDGLIKAFELVCKEKDIQLSIVGASGLSFQKLKKKNYINCQGKIKFWGQINDPETLITLYQKNICLLFPSFYEASPLPPIEAMACGCPVISSNIPALRERCGDAAIYCDPYDVQNIAKAVLSLFENAELRNDIVEKGRLRAENYNWITSALKIFQIIEKVI